METFLQVQKGAPVDLLLGTDVLSHLYSHFPGGRTMGS